MIKKTNKGKNNNKITDGEPEGRRKEGNYENGIQRNAKEGHWLEEQHQGSKMMREREK